MVQRVPSINGYAGGGAGWLSDGANGGGTACAIGYGGTSPLSGGAGGAYSGNTSAGGYGGGGGGGGWCNIVGAGGGGGYSGGGAGGAPSPGGPFDGGGGGGSFNSGTSQSNSIGNSGMGLVIISYAVIGITVVQTAGLPSGSTFPVGTTINTFEATDASGNSTTCSQTVTVKDTEIPSITCSGDVTKQNSPAQCGYTVDSYSNPTEFDPISVSDNCSGWTVTNNYNNLSTLSGASFPIGTTNVTWTVTDGGGNTNSCSFNITIEDHQNPLVQYFYSMPVTKNTDPSKCTYQAVGTELDPSSVTDNCPDIASLTFSTSGATTTSGSNTLAGVIFNQGTTNVQWIATDAHGNTGYGFLVVEVTDNENPTISCATPLASYSTDGGSCYYKVPDNSLDPTANDNCTVASVTNDFNNVSSLNGAVFPKGTSTVTWTVTDSNNNTATCTQTIIVKDNELPIITCPADFTVNADSGVCTASGVVLGTPTYSDNCAFATPVNEFYCTNNAGTSLMKINATTGAATDIGSFGFSDAFALAFTPDGKAWTLLNGYSNSQLANVDLTTGAATPVGTAFNFNSFDLEADASGQLIAVGSGDGNLYKINSTTGATSLVGFTGLYQMMDLAFDASGKLWAYNSNGNLYSINTTNGSATLESTLSGGIDVGMAMGLAINQSGTFYMTEYTPSPRLFSLDPATGVTTYISDLAASMPHGGDFLPESGATNNAPAIFPIGTTVVTWSVTDAAGNIGTCTQTVTVKDNELPIITCPADVAITSFTGLCYATGVDLGTPVTSDNCSVDGFINDAPVNFMPGNTIVTWTVTDGSGNNATCTQNVYVNLLPVAAGTITGDVIVCQGENSVTYTVPDITNATSYIWTLPTGATGTSTTSSITVNYGATAVSGDITVTGNNSCGNGDTSTLSITVYNSVIANISGGASPICYNTNPGILTASGSNGSGSYTYLWYKNGISTGVTTQTYDPGNLTATSTFYCAITSEPCGTVNTPTTTIMVYGNLAGVNSGGTSPLCYNNAPGTITAIPSGGTGVYTYLWYKNGVSTGITTQAYTPGNLTTTSTFYCEITSVPCGTIATPTTTIIVYGNLSAVITGGTSPVCYNTSPGALTANATGGTGWYTYLWYKNGVSTGITTKIYTPANLTVNTTFYCVVTSGSCGTVTTPTDTITVYTNLTAAISGGSTSICYNTAPGTFTATGGGGSGIYTYLWYKNGIATGVTTQTYAPGNLTANASVYCAISSGTCGPVNTPTITISVMSNIIANISGGNSPICYNTAPGTFTATASGGNGSYTYLWYKNGISTGITTQTYTPGNLTITSTFYCAVSSGSCGPVNTPTTTITVYDNIVATISGGTSPICYNSLPGMFTVNATGGTGTYSYMWYKDGVSTGIIAQTYTPNDLTATTTFYCVVTSGSCGPVSTPTITITVYGNLTAAISGGTSPLCYNSSPGTFTATAGGGTGSYTYLWYKDGVSTGVTTPTYSPGNLTATSTFYCAITSGTCGTVNTPTTTITVYGNLTATISGGTSPICYNSYPGTLTVTAGGGTGTYTYLWYKDGISTGITTQIYFPGNLTTTTTFYCVVTSGSCGSVTSATTTITVYNTLTAGISGGTSPICANTSPGTLTATGNGGSGSYTYLWYKNGTNTGVTTQTYAPGNLTSTSTFYCAVTSGSCGTVNTSTITITVNPTYSFTENHTICHGDVYNWHGTNYSTGGTYTANYTTIHSCDSIYTLHLTVNTVDASVTVYNNMITANATGATYQWVDCNNAYAPMSGYTSQSFSATYDGNYAVIVTIGSCSDTSVCVPILTVGIPSSQEEQISIYPNPVSEELTIEISGNKETKEFEIINSIGQIVFVGNMVEKTTVKMDSYATGIYFVKLQSGGNITYKKIIKE